MPRPRQTPTEIYAKLLDILCFFEDFKGNRLILESSCEMQEDLQQAIYKLAGLYFTLGVQYGLDEEQELVELSNE